MTNEPGTIGRLVRWNTKKSLAFVRTLAFEFPDETSGRVGQIQGLIGAEISPKLGDALVAHIEDAFENGLEEAVRKLPASAPQEKLFEAAVAKVNHALSRLLSDRGLVIPADGVSGVLIAQLGSDTVAAVWGDPSMLLVRRLGPGRTKVFNVLEGAANERTATSPRGFSNLISGTLSDKDLMLVSNESILDLLDPAALTDILSGGTPDTVTQLLTDALTAEHDDLSLAMLLLEGIPERSERTVNDAPRRTQRVAPPKTVPRAKSERAVVTPKPSNALKNVSAAAAAVSSRVAEATGSILSSGKDAVAKAIEERRMKQKQEEALAMTEGAIHDEEAIVADAVAAAPVTPVAPAPEANVDATLRAADALEPEPPKTAPKAEVAPIEIPKKPVLKRKSAESVADLLPKNEPVFEQDDERVDASSLVVATTAARKKALKGKITTQRAMINEATIIAAARADAARIIAARARDAERAKTAMETESVTPAAEAPKTVVAKEPVRSPSVVDVGFPKEKKASETPVKATATALPSSAVPTRVDAPASEEPADAGFLPSSREALDRMRTLAREGTGGAMNGMRHWFSGLPMKRRWLLMASLALIVFLNVSVGFAGVQRYRERAVADYEQQLTSIEQKVNSAEASMIYRDEDRSRRLLEEAAGIVAALPEKTDEQIGKKAELAAFINGKFDSLRHAVTLPAPEVAAAVVADGGSAELVRLGSYAGTLWASDRNGDVYRIENGEAKKTGDGIRTDIFVPRRDGLLTGGAGTLTLVKDSGSATALTFDTGSDEVSIDDSTMFGSRLYLLDAAHNRILRHTAIDGGYAAPQQYVKDATDLSDAVSFAIDGYVYVLSKNGEVLRLLRGDRTDYAVSDVDPAIDSAVRLRTESEEGDLYVLDTDPARIIRYNKATGMLVTQYESDELTGATDFTVDEENKKFLVLKGNQVLSFDWPSLE